MAHTNAPAQTALANVFLTRIPLNERSHVIRDLAAHVDNDTVGLVAALTAQAPDTQAEQSLHAFFTRAVECNEPSAAASFCLQYVHIREALLARAGKELRVVLALLLQQPKNSGLVVPSSNLDFITPNLAGLSLEADAERSVEDIVKQAVVYLDFMKHVFRLPSKDNTFTISQGTIHVMLGLLAASNTAVASAARDSCFAFLASFKSELLVVTGSDDVFGALDDRVWETVNSLLTHSSHSAYRTTAYAVWLRWLDLPTAFEGVKQLDSYWGHLLSALASGDVEQRKTCLHILRKSVATLHNSLSTKDMLFVPADCENGMSLPSCLHFLPRDYLIGSFNRSRVLSCPAFL